MRKTFSVLLYVLLCSVLGSCAPKAPAISGRILFTDSFRCVDGKFNLYEYKAGMAAPVQISTVPCDDRSGFYIPSRDHHILLLNSADASQRKFVDLTTGKAISAPEKDPPIETSMDAWDFSPDDRYFAHTDVAGDRADLYIFDLQEGKDSILFKNPCSYYQAVTGPMGGSEYKCPRLGKVAWLDSTTLIINAYVGELPDEALWSKPIPPNATLILDLDGQVLQTFQPVLQFWGVRGQTILFYIEGQGKSGYGWMDTAELKSGKVDLRPLDSRIDQFPQGYEGDVTRILYPDVTPDGLFIFQTNLGYHLLGIHTASDLGIPRAGVNNCNGA
ncbi:MAG TPA: hypothetical protein VMC85_04190, partial [Desulfomonilaceae bacterium]|nr:hypothetical protein [Desulfomonilaceae bacterium]